MQDCIFCKIVSKEIPSAVIYEDDEVLAFLNIRPVSKGHALVVPKKHFPDFLNADDAVLADLMPKAKQISQAILKATGAAGFNLTTNNGAASGQEIFHLHFHIIPRYNNDGLSSWPHSESEPKTREQMAEEIKKFL